MNTPSAGRRYDRVAMSLHWLIAIAIILNLALGWWMHEAMTQGSQQALATQAYQWHKSIGLSVLGLSLLRLIWRLAHRPPALPHSMASWERRAAGLTHVAFYVLMLSLPLSGWLYVSTQWRGDAPLSVPTLWFGWWEVPHLLGLNQMGDVLRSQWADRFALTHELLANLTIALLLLHVGAALKHQFLSRDDVMLRMLPARRRTALAGLLVLLSISGLLLSLADFSGDSASASGGQIQSSDNGWQVNAQRSAIAFSGEHAGEAFAGQFGSWQVDLQLQASAPQSSRVQTRIDTGSASTGNRLHDETLRQGEWFDVDRYPDAQFHSQRVEAGNDGSWHIHGVLRIKEHEKTVGPLILRFKENQATIHAEIQVDRADFKLGMDSDPAGDWVSRDIVIRIEVVASPP